MIQKMVLFRLSITLNVSDGKNITWKCFADLETRSIDDLKILAQNNAIIKVTKKRIIKGIDLLIKHYEIVEETS